MARARAGTAAPAAWQRREPSMTEMVARYSSTCPVCRLRIRAGDALEQTEGQPARHAHCPAGGDSTTTRRGGHKRPPANRADSKSGLTKTQRKQLVLAALTETTGIDAACASVGVKRDAFDDWFDHSPEFRRRANDSLAQAAVKEWRCEHGLENGTDGIPSETLRAYLIEALALQGIVTHACRTVGVNRDTYYEGCHHYPEFKRLADEARAIAAADAELEVRQRAMVGIEEPVGFYKGVPGAWVRRKSDALLQFLVRAKKPEFATDRLEVRGVFANVDMTRLSDSEIDRLAGGG